MEGVEFIPLSKDILVEWQKKEVSLPSYIVQHPDDPKYVVVIVSNTVADPGGTAMVALMSVGLSDKAKKFIYAVVKIFSHLKSAEETEMAKMLSSIAGANYLGTICANPKVMTEEAQVDFLAWKTQEPAEFSKTWVVLNNYLKICEIDNVQKIQLSRCISTELMIDE